MNPRFSSAETTIGHVAPRIPRGLSRDFIALAHDLLALGDACAIGLSGAVSGLLWMQLSLTRVLPGQVWATFGSRVDGRSPDRAVRAARLASGECA